jgi:DNA-binding transcriptional LysR family regulator
MDVNRLRHFLAVLDHGSIGRAAEALHLSQPALSKSIRRLEDSLKARLIDRSARGATATVFGQALAERARLIFVEIRNAEQDLDALRGLQTGQVAVGANTSVISQILARALHNLRRERPGVRVAVQEGLISLLIEPLAQGKLDFVVGSLPAQLGDVELDREPLYEDDLIVVCRPRHPLLARRRPTLKDLLDYPWTLANEPEPARVAIDRAFRAVGLTPPVPDVTANTSYCMVSAVLEGDFLSFLPHRLIHRAIANKVMVSVPVKDLRCRRLIEIAYRSRSTLSPAARALADETRAVCRALGLRPAA